MVIENPIHTDITRPRARSDDEDHRLLATQLPHTIPAGDDQAIAPRIDRGDSTARLLAESSKSVVKFEIRVAEFGVGAETGSAALAR